MVPDNFFPSFSTTPELANNFVNTKNGNNAGRIYLAQVDSPSKQADILSFGFMAKRMMIMNISSDNKMFFLLMFFLYLYAFFWYII